MLNACRQAVSNKQRVNMRCPIKWQILIVSAVPCMSALQVKAGARVWLWAEITEPGCILIGVYTYRLQPTRLLTPFPFNILLHWKCN